MSMTVFDPDYVAPADERPLRARPFGSLAATMIGASALIVLCVALAFRGGQPAEEARDWAEPPAASVARAPAAPAAAKPAGAAKPSAAFDLSAPEFAKEKKVVATRRLEPDGGREDSLTIGQFALGGPFLRLDFAQSGGEKFTNSDFFLDMHRRAEKAGLEAGKISSLGPLATRFGAFEAADVRLSQPAGAGAPAAERACLALRLVNAKMLLEISGFACGAAAKPIDRRALACVLDRIEYRPSGANTALDRFFVNAELARGQGCPGAGPSAAAERASWFDAHSVIPSAKPGAAAAKPAAPVPPKPAVRKVRSAQ